MLELVLLVTCRSNFGLENIFSVVAIITVNIKKPKKTYSKLNALGLPYTYFKQELKTSLGSQRWAIASLTFVNNGPLHGLWTLLKLLMTVRRIWLQSVYGDPYLVSWTTNKWMSLILFFFIILWLFKLLHGYSE